VLDAFAAGDLERAAAWFAEDAIYRERGRDPVRGRAAIAQHFRRFGSSSAGWKFVVQDALREGDRACVMYRFSSAGGKGEPWRERDGCATVRFDKGGLIAEWREYQG
jgi:ketosteroid isomerase-like protein